MMRIALLDFPAILSFVISFCLLNRIHFHDFPLAFLFYHLFLLKQFFLSFILKIVVVLVIWIVCFLIFFYTTYLLLLLVWKKDENDADTQKEFFFCALLLSVFPFFLFVWRFFFRSSYGCYQNKLCFHSFLFHFDIIFVHFT